MITAKQAYDTAITVSGQREKEEKELEKIERLIEERINIGAFFVDIPEFIFDNNKKKLLNLGYQIIVYYGDIQALIRPYTHISWYKDEEEK